MSHIRFALAAVALIANRLKKSGRHTLVSFALILMGTAGCSTVVVMPDGQRSAMDSESNDLRSHLTIAEKALSGPLSYKSAAKCIYANRYEAIDKPSQKAPLSVLIGPFDHDIGATIRDGTYVSTAWMNTKGKLFSFNVQDVDNGQRYNDQTYEREMYQKLAQFKAGEVLSGVRNAHALNEMSLLTPDFSADPRNPGDDAAVVSQEDGAVWGTYKYRGITQYSGTTAAVFDLVRQFPSDLEAGPALVGFNVVDLKTMLPVLFVLNAGLNIRLERASCNR